MYLLWHIVFIVVSTVGSNSKLLESSIYDAIKNVISDERYRCGYVQKSFLIDEFKFLKKCSNFTVKQVIYKERHTEDSAMCLLYLNNIQNLCNVSDITLESTKLLENYRNWIAKYSNNTEQVCQNFKNITALKELKPGIDIVLSTLNKNCQTFCTDSFDENKIREICLLTSFMANMANMYKGRVFIENNNTGTLIKSKPTLTNSNSGTDSKSEVTDKNKRVSTAVNERPKDNSRVDQQNKGVSELHDSSANDHEPENRDERLKPEIEKTKMNSSIFPQKNTSEQSNKGVHSQNVSVGVQTNNTALRTEHNRTANPEKIIDASKTSDNSMENQFKTETGDSLGQSDMPKKVITIEEARKSETRDNLGQSDMTKKVITVEEARKSETRDNLGQSDMTKKVITVEEARKSETRDNLGQSGTTKKVITVEEVLKSETGDNLGQSGMIKKVMTVEEALKSDISANKNENTEKSASGAAAKITETLDDINDGDAEEYGYEKEVPKSSEVKSKTEKLLQAKEDSATFPANFRNQNIDTEDSYFFSYFMMLCIVFALGYIGYHNKQKIFALVLEGRRGRRNSRVRRPNSANYRKLDSNLEEALTSSCTKSTSQVIY